MKTEFKNKNAARKLIVITFLTLDGVMQAPGARAEDNEGGFQHGGWQMPFFEDDENPMAENLDKAGALLLGRKTYDIFASYWPTVGKDIEWFGPFMNIITKYVASKSLHKTDWQNSILLKGDVNEAVAKLKQEAGKDIYVLGSGDLAQTLMRHNLIDEYLLMIHPLALGPGKRLFQHDGPKQDLELTKSKISKDGVLVLNYRVKG
jgi:dihydrofolate reductase